MTQLSRLCAALSSRPNDPFLLYAIAMEHLKLGQLETALDNFESLVQSHASYLPTYYQYGVTLSEIGRLQLAKQILDRGHAVALEAGNSHTAAEIAQVLNDIKNIESDKF